MVSIDAGHMMIFVDHTYSENTRPDLNSMLLGFAVVSCLHKCHAGYTICMMYPLLCSCFQFSNGGMKRFIWQVSKTLRGGG